MGNLDKCIVCNSSHFNLHLKINLYNFFQCNNCKLLFINPIPNGFIDNNKRVDFFTNYNWAGYDRESFEKQVISAKKKLPGRLSFLQKSGQERINNVLEIGAGMGPWSKAFEGSGIQYLGVEIDRTAVEAGKKFGANLIHGDFLSDDLPQSMVNNFDMIYASQVFEHVFSPHIFLEKLRKLLKEDGIIYLDIPNPNGIIPTLKKYKLFRKNKRYEEDYCFLQPPWHYIAYPDQTIKYIMRLHGLNLIHLSHPGIYHPFFGQLGEYSTLDKIVDYFFSLFNVGNLSLILAKKINNSNRAVLPPLAQARVQDCERSGL